MADSMLSQLSCSPPRAGTPPRVATVEDMLEWLRWDGWYRGIVGWCTEYSDTELFSPREAERDGSSRFAAFYSPGSWKPPQRDFDLNAGLREASYMEEHEKFVRRMIESHKKLLVEAIEEVDRRLVQAGLSVEQNENADKRASSVYAKLQRLEEAKRKRRPDPRVRVQVICHAGNADTGYEPVTLDLHLPHKWTEHELRPINGENPGQERIWNYRVIGKNDHIMSLREGSWHALRSQEDFTMLMREIVRDSSKLAVICHETDLQQRRNLTAPEQWKDVTPDDMWKALGLDHSTQWNEDEQIKWGSEASDSLMDLVDNLPDDLF
ncbi:hypothetical protein T310_6915 [Rasamsonia emersonii CBS 393.64]|uniref:Uncharacterized protein n=1 Tax=Rasamsonia emersonii (strain ATCC 16479 / CBS 393.64 / IMI 116815) TaxID=1408163 RepID=A0A0F4YLN0_RASE3|nr:hypothetical protein T310_6915 [Rasamsonia emersonii CBS 393.64]KKA19124.1 hypothetical protein T310_6915 [Rasamsonia emersonii CBS 393.64]